VSARRILEELSTTNCSERLGRIAANCLGVDLAVIVTAERAGFYKPRRRRREYRE